jgi:hypothetical protein
LTKIPLGTKTVNVLVGEVDFLDEQDEEIMCLIRLQKPFVLGKLSEIPIATKFLFVLLGPRKRGNMIKYRQIGKSLITLMSDEVNFGVFFFRFFRTFLAFKSI